MSLNVICAAMGRFLHLFTFFHVLFSFFAAKVASALQPYRARQRSEMGNKSTSLVLMKGRGVSMCPLLCAPRLIQFLTLCSSQHCSFFAFGFNWQLVSATCTSWSTSTVY
ncbi:hypothetical protein K438DRAFT_583408 [Mycena galopus ATCC 62051]|nr:hypothetical protein K438DRAFT_583408 [Mycena galopus ATCC 62051]